jgi:hypothetical protein
LAGLGLVLLAGYMAGQAGRASREVCADVTELPRREAFLAGGERSEIVLRDLLTVLKRIDSRLENIEKTVAGKPAQTKKK